MEKILIVGMGGFIGSVLRYWLGGLSQSLVRNLLFPIGTLTVNLLGCLAIGILSELAESRNLFSPELRLLLLTGILGGFTTFSSFSNESLSLIRDGQNLLAGINVLVSVGLGLAAVWLGRSLVQLMWR